MKWSTKPLGTLCLKIGSGVTPRGGDSVYMEDGVSLIRSQNVYNSFFEVKGLAHITDEQADSMKGVEVLSGDVLLNITGDSVARSCQVPENILPARVNQHVSIIRTKTDQLSPDFLLYYLISPYMQSCMLSLAGSGGTRKALTKKMIEDFKIVFPPLKIQKSIVEILSAYDDLIENNRRRIQLLEESARLLYEEWFVRFRFPGHEHVKIVNGIPDGWEYRNIDNVCSALEDGDWIETKDQGGDDYRLLQISNIGNNQFIETGNFRYITEETFNRLNCREILPGHILIARMPTPIGRAWLVTEMPWKMITAVDVAILIPDPFIADPYFLLHHLNSTANIKLCESRAVGATRPRITRKNIGFLPVLLPPINIQKMFRELSEPMNLQRAILSRKNEKLSTARDLLLPKLMNGEITI